MQPLNQPDRAVIFNREAPRLPDVPHEPPWGPLGPFVADPHVSDIFVCGTSLTICRDGRLLAAGSLASTVVALDLALHLATAGGRDLSLAQPFQSITLGHCRVGLTIPPYSLEPSVSVRIHRPRRWTADLLRETGTFDAEVEARLLGIAHSRRSFVVAGPTGAGKTTLTRWMVSQMPADDRIVVVEEVRELFLADCHPHVVELETRPANREGRFAVSTRDAVRHALHLRPDRLGIGELRGGEAFEWLLALTSGHSGSFATIHALSADRVHQRLAWLAQTAMPSASTGFLEQSFRTELGLIVVMARAAGGTVVAAIEDHDGTFTWSRPADREAAL